MATDYEISCSTPEQRPFALRLLHSGLSEDQQGPLVHALEATSTDQDAEFAGLLVATSGGQLRAVTWIQLTAGKSAVVWPPEPHNPASLAIMRAVPDFLLEHHVTLAQVVVSPAAPCDLEMLQAAKFQKLADLAYLFADSHYFPPQAPQTELEFLPNADSNPQKFGQLMARTYQGSLDCPALNGIRDMDDVLKGYAAQGNYDPAHWYTIHCNGQDIGTLILASHSNGEQWELVYMGIVPEGRGSGFGTQIVKFALWQASQAGAERLVLAVDKSNHFALSMYQQAGFISWDARTVYGYLNPSVKRGKA